MEDKRIFQFLWQRAEQAIEAMTAQYGPRLYRTAMNILGRHEDAEESVNDTYLAVWNAIPPETPEPLAGYVYKTGRNLALNRLRRNSALKRRSDYDLSLEELEGCLPGACLQDEIEARETERILQEKAEIEAREAAMREEGFVPYDEVYNDENDPGMKDGE